MNPVFQALLLATEHTEFDRGAETLALQLAQRCGLPLRGVVPMVSNPEFEVQAPDLAARADQLAAAHIAALQARAKSMDVVLKVNVRRGSQPEHEIVDEARETGSDLLIIRRRGRRSFLARLLLGEMVSRVVARAPCSVLIVPREAAMWSNRILVAVDANDHGLRIVARASAVAAQCGLPLRLIHVCRLPDRRAQADEFMRSALELASGVGVSADAQILSGGEVSSSILQAMSDAAADLLVIGRRNSPAASPSTLGSVAQQILGLAQSPVLVAFAEPQAPTTQ